MTFRIVIRFITLLITFWRLYRTCQKHVLFSSTRPNEILHGIVYLTRIASPVQLTSKIEGKKKRFNEFDSGFFFNRDLSFFKLNFINSLFTLAFTSDTQIHTLKYVWICHPCWVDDSSKEAGKFEKIQNHL